MTLSSTLRGKQVVRGGYNVFSSARAVLIEMSFVSMYDYQPLVEEVQHLVADLACASAEPDNPFSDAVIAHSMVGHCLHLLDA
jgi:hypothetical protein